MPRFLSLRRLLTVRTMHSDSNMAPQHPKNAIKNIAEPITMNKIGATLTFMSLNASRTSSYFNRNPTPTAIRAIPHNWNQPKKINWKKKPLSNKRCENVYTNFDWIDTFNGTSWHEWMVLFSMFFLLKFYVRNNALSFSNIICSSESVWLWNFTLVLKKPVIFILRFGMLWPW